MSATILPADEMINVLTDAIVSKRHTIELMEKAAKEAQVDLSDLRVARARLMAKAAGFEVGQVWIVQSYRRDRCPGVIYDIRSAYGGAADDLTDWLIDIAFRNLDGDRVDTDAIIGRDAARACVGLVKDGSLVEALRNLRSEIQQRREKAERDNEKVRA